MQPAATEPQATGAPPPAQPVTSATTSEAASTAPLQQPAAPPTSSSDGTAPSAATGPAKKKPLVCILIGMAGSGKTTLMQRINAELHQHKKKGYIINLDPAVTYMPYKANIDIRETVNYKEVMKQYGLGPNGGILTSLNLFATRFDQVLGFIEKRQATLDYVFIDTPGQIEVFTWSASGQVRSKIITEAIASGFPTCVAYIIDTPRSTAPNTFMSNMLYACSIMYKTKLPLIVLFNKIDMQPHDFLLRWMSDVEAFQTALHGDESYATSLAHSMSLVLEEFYANLSRVGVSATTGQGLPEFFDALTQAAKEYDEFYLPQLEAQKRRKERREAAQREAQMARLRKDMAEVALGAPARPDGSAAHKHPFSPAASPPPPGSPSVSAPSGPAAAAAAAAPGTAPAKPVNAAGLLRVRRARRSDEYDDQGEDDGAEGSRRPKGTTGAGAGDKEEEEDDEPHFADEDDDGASAGGGDDDEEEDEEDEDEEAEYGFGVEHEPEDGQHPVRFEGRQTRPVRAAGTATKM